MNQPIYDKIGQSYNTTRRVEPHLAERLLSKLNVQPDGLYLDIGCGTGNYTLWLAEKGLPFWGVDPSDIMLAESRQRSLNSVANNVQWLIGHADSIPAADQTFDGAIAMLTIHHWPDLVSAFGELSRVLKLNSRLVLFTATPEQMQTYWLNYYFPKMLTVSAEQMPSLETIIQSTSSFKLVDVEAYWVRPDSVDLFLYSGKHRPEVYLNPTVRKGISSFANLADEKEVNKGLSQLQVDIVTGSFDQVRASYDSPQGDYSLITLCRV